MALKVTGTSEVKGLRGWSSDLPVFYPKVQVLSSKPSAAFTLLASEDSGNGHCLCHVGSFLGQRYSDNRHRTGRFSNIKMKSLNTNPVSAIFQHKLTGEGGGMCAEVVDSTSL